MAKSMIYEETAPIGTVPAFRMCHKQIKVGRLFNLRYKGIKYPGTFRNIPGTLKLFMATIRMHYKNKKTGNISQRPGCSYEKSIVRSKIEKTRTFRNGRATVT